MRDLSFCLCVPQSLSLCATVCACLFVCLSASAMLSTPVWVSRSPCDSLPSAGRLFMSLCDAVGFFMCLPLCVCVCVCVCVLYQQVYLPDYLMPCLVVVAVFLGICFVGRGGALEDRGFKSPSRRHVRTLGKSFTCSCL